MTMASLLRPSFLSRLQIFQVAPTLPNHQLQVIDRVASKDPGSQRARGLKLNGFRQNHRAGFGARKATGKFSSQVSKVGSVSVQMASLSRLSKRMQTLQDLLARSSFWVRLELYYACFFASLQPINQVQKVEIMAYHNIDPVLNKFLSKRGVQLLKEDVGSLRRYFYISSNVGDVFQIVIEPEKEKSVRIDGHLIESPDDDECHFYWEIALVELANALDICFGSAETWFSRSRQ